ncbi:MAG TPA: CusA/CzcA family heavy metal efflux RND transporter [Polyangia bacterium]|nr:CusA/CzcA family heavy metal efflux RND transporter [Polyangia bacterium]
MIQRLVRFVLRMPAFVVILAAGLLALGLYCYKQLDIEAYPNPVPPMIEIITQPNGWSAEEVERYVTIPLENGLNGMIDLDHIRSQSLFGLSDVKCYFTWNVDYHTAEQRVLNRLNFVNLPPGMSPQLSPWSAIGEIYRYVVRGDGYDLTQLKTAEDWTLERQFRQAPGVIDVVGFGGLTKEYHVEVDPYRLKGHGLTLNQLTAALSNANLNVGGQRLTLGEQSFNVRGIGLFHSLNDIREVVIAEQHGTPVRVRDVADVSIGHAPRLGIVGKDLEPDVVQGTVLMRYGGDSLKTLANVHDKVDQIAKYHILPPGMRTETYYDRAKLVELTTHTVIENLITGMVLVALVLWLFLGHGRAALITALNIPLALMIAFVGMVATGTPANLISLGAVDFGIVVDSTVIMMENIFRHLSLPGKRNKIERILLAASEVGPPMFSSTLVIAVAFIPLFTLTGVAGVIFSPMAHTYAFAIGGAIVLALTLTPVLAERGLAIGAGGEREPADAEHEHEHDNFMMRALKRFYMPLFAFSLRHKRAAVAIGAVVVLVSLGAGSTLGREFMPKLEEGNFWIRATLPMSISLEQSSKYVGRMRAVILGCADVEHCDLAHRARPEITTVVSQLGRPDDGTDVSGFYNIELFAPLKPANEWPRGVTKASMTAQLSHELQEAFPGVIFNFSQMISDNVEEAMSGVKGENTVKVVGPDLTVNEAKANEIVDVMSTVKGVEDLGLFPSLGQPNVRITPDRVQCGRYGLNVGDVEAVVQAAIGGQAITQVYEGEKRFDLTVRWAPAFRKDLRAIRGILVATPDGAQVPLGQLAQIAEEEGPSLIYREDNRRYAPVKFSVRGRDLASTIDEAREKIAERVKLPYDTHLEWAGEINQLNEATGRLILIIPITLLVIAMLVYSSVKNWKDMLIVLGGIPVACTGGILALLFTHTHFSISAAMGFISIFGISVQDALIVVTYAQRLWDEGHGLETGAREAAERRLRPVLMTTFVAMLGLTPAALSHGIGADTQKPLAIVVIGGALILAVLPRLLQPALLVLAHAGERRWTHRSAAERALDAARAEAINPAPDPTPSSA